MRFIPDREVRIPTEHPCIPPSWLSCVEFASRAGVLRMQGGLAVMGLAAD